MISLRLRGIALAFGPLLIAVTALFAPVSAQAQENAPLFINLTNDDPWKASMAAFFATNFALKQGHKPVVIFVNVQAPPYSARARRTSARSSSDARCMTCIASSAQPAARCWSVRFA